MIIKEVQLYTSNISASVAIDSQDGKELQIEKLGQLFELASPAVEKLPKPNMLRFSKTPNSNLF